MGDGPVTDANQRAAPNETEITMTTMAEVIAEQQAEAKRARIKKALDEMTHDQVDRVYSGLPGCGCGCRGKYSNAKGMVTRTLNAMRERIDEVEVTNGLGNDGPIYTLEDETRFRWLYTVPTP